jgi:uncharacterized membrane protein YjdF
MARKGGNCRGATIEQRPSEGSGLARRAHLAVLAVLQLIMVLELVTLLATARWLHAFLVFAILTVTLVPELVRRRVGVEIPSEVQLVIVLFVFASIFLGEVRDYYERIWWWDLALHMSAGFLLGLLGFLVVHVLNESSRVEVSMPPSLVAMFAFFFSVAIGALWEIFEFTMDQLFGLTMQKPMGSDPSGLTDTMWDLIVDTIGAAVVALAGWRYLKAARRRYLDTWVSRFIRRNRRFRFVRRTRKNVE